jgi:hypothetical protein
MTGTGSGVLGLYASAEERDVNLPGYEGRSPKRAAA